MGDTTSHIARGMPEGMRTIRVRQYTAIIYDLRASWAVRDWVTRLGGRPIAVVNAIYARYFPKDAPARIFINVPAWPGHFDIEIDCIAAVL